MSRTRIVTIQDRSGNFSQGVHHISKGSCACWVNFSNNGTIGADYNVNTVGDNGTGDYTVNFTTNFATNVYTYAGTFGNGYGGGSSCAFIVPQDTGNDLVGSCRVLTKDVSGTSSPSGGAEDFAGRAMIFFYGDR